MYGFDDKNGSVNYYARRVCSNPYLYGWPEFLERVWFLLMDMEYLDRMGVPLSEFEGAVDRILRVVDALFCRGHRMDVSDVLLPSDHPLVAGMHEDTLRKYLDRVMKASCWMIGM